MRKFLCLLMISLLICCTAASAWGTTNAEQYENAMGLLKEYKYAEAGEAFAALGGYGDSPRYAMYCNAIAAGEAGLYAVAVENLQSLSGFLDSDLLAVYYAGLSWEAGEDYEHAAEVLGSITLYRDVATRIDGYPALISARDYKKADANEQAGHFELALAGFTALGSYQDSVSRAATVQEKIHARDYAAAVSAEELNKLEDALSGFKALGGYSDSADRAAAVTKKIEERDAEAAEKARADAYTAADKAEQDGDFATAYAGFADLGDYRDSTERAAAVQDKGNYAQALQYAMEGEFSQAYTLFSELGDYEDSKEKAYVLSVTSFSSVSVSDRSRGIAAFKLYGLWGLFNTNTNTVTSPYWDSIEEFNDYGLARVRKDDLYGYINTDGETVIPCEWYGISAFSDEGMCTAANREITKTTYGSSYIHYYFGLYDSSGEQITPVVWRTLGDSSNTKWGTDSNTAEINVPVFNNGKIKVQNSKGLYGFMNTEGTLTCQPRWTFAYGYSEGLAAVAEDKKYGFIDENGRIIIQPQYDDAMWFSEGLAGVKKDGYWQYINRENEVVIPARYEFVGLFSQGKADVFLPGIGWQIIDSTGNLLYFMSPKMYESYEFAKSQFDAGNYYEAYTSFSNIAGYRDSDELAAQARTLLPSYTIVQNIPGATYGFAQNSNGWYESQNKGKSNSFAICVVKFVTYNDHFSVKVINNGEVGKDYGLISYLDSTLIGRAVVDNRVFKSYEKGNTVSIDTITFDVPDHNEHFIYIKYIKNGSVDKGNDSLRFRFE